MVLAHWNNSLWVDMLLHLDTLFWFRVNKLLLFLLNAAYLAEKQQIPISVFSLTRQELKPTIYRNRGDHANHYTTDAFHIFWIIAHFA
jgi:hypothetical protein